MVSVVSGLKLGLGAFRGLRLCLSTTEDFSSKCVATKVDILLMDYANSQPAVTL